MTSASSAPAPVDPNDAKVKELEAEWEKLRLESERRGRWSQQILSGLLVIIVLGALAFALFGGGLRRLNLGFGRGAADIQLGRGEGGAIPILTGPAGARELLLLSVDTGRPESLTRGARGATQAAVAPNGLVVAYALSAADGATLQLESVISPTLPLTTTFPASSLTAAGAAAFQWPETTICPWSELWWSPSATHLAFYACGDNASALFVVTAAAGAFPQAAPESVSPAQTAREAAWVDDQRLVFPTGEAELTRVVVWDRVSGAGATLYGPAR